jgi:hypothetical protein
MGEMVQTEEMDAVNSFTRDFRIFRGKRVQTLWRETYLQEGVFRFGVKWEITQI